MSQELAETRFLMEKLNAIESRLESIERMLKIDFIDPRQFGAIPDESECLIPMFDARGMSLMPDGSDPMQCRSKRITGAKLKVIHIYGDTYHSFGIRLDKEHWAACKIKTYVTKWEIVKKSQIAKFGELTQEETEEAIRRGILECSAVEQEPEWRQMSTAPKDRDIKVKLNGEVRIAWFYSKDEWNVSGCVLPESYFEGWRPL